jgi:hypothetical protein
MIRALALTALRRPAGLRRRIGDARSAAECPPRLHLVHRPGHLADARGLRAALFPEVRRSRLERARAVVARGCAHASASRLDQRARGVADIETKENRAQPLEIA